MVEEVTEEKTKEGPIGSKNMVGAEAEEVRKETGKETGKEENLFESKAVPAAYVTLALPVVLGMVVSLLYNMVDTYFIAKTGDTSLVAGVALGAPVFTLMIALGDIFGLGGSSVVSRLFGQGREADAKRLSSFCFYTALGCGVLVAILLLAFRMPVLSLLGATEETLPHASAYYSWYVVGAPFSIVLFTPSNLLRTEGLAKESMFGTILGSVVNIILDPIFIFTLGLGAAGAAIATVLGNLCADLFFLWVYLAKSKKLSVDIGLCRITMGEFVAMMTIGIPASITNLMQSLGITLTNRFLLPYGTEKVAAMGIAMKVSMIAMLILVGFAFGGQPLFGYTYGAGQKKRLTKILRFAYGTELALALVLGTLLWFLAPSFLGFFMKEEGILTAGVPMLRLLQMGMPFTAITLITTCVFQSTGKALGAFLLSVSRQGVIYALVLFCFSRLLGYQGVIASQAGSDFLTALLALFLFTRMLWGEIRE